MNIAECKKSTAEVIMGCKRNIVLDQGWSWIVLCSAFVAMVLSFGLPLSLTVYLEDFKLEFDIGSREAGMLHGTSLLFLSLMGPAANYVCLKAGFRAVFMSSGLIIAISMLLSSITTTYTQMLCTMILTGIGFSFSYTPASVITGFYFRKHYVLANGIVFSGVNAGIFAFPVLLEYLRSWYNWRVCYRLIAAVSLHICVAGALIPPPPHVATSKPTTQSATGSITSRRSSISNRPINDANDENISNVLEEELHDKINVLALEEHQPDDPNETFAKSAELTNELNETNTILRRLAAYGTYCCNTFELRLFLSLDFMLMFMVMFAYSVGFIGTIIHYVARFQSSGFTTAQSGFLLSLLGIGGVASRLTHGFLVDRKCIKATHMFCITLVIGGILIFSLTFISSYIWSQVMSFSIGFSMAVYAPLCSVIVKDLVGIERFKSAFGLIILAYCGGDFIGSLLPGWIYDLTNDYNKSFYMTSSCLLLASFLMMVLMLMDHNKRLRYRGHYNRSV